MCALSSRRTASLGTVADTDSWRTLEKGSIDVTGSHPKSTKQNQYTLTAVDHFQNWAETLALRNRTAPTVARALMVHVFSRFGSPVHLLSDRGPEFQSEIFSQLMQWMEIDKIRTTAYKPSTCLLYTSDAADE